MSPQEYMRLSNMVLEEMPMYETAMIEGMLFGFNNAWEKIAEIAVPSAEFLDMRSIVFTTQQMFIAVGLYTEVKKRGIDGE